MTLGKIFKRYRLRMLTTFAMVVVEGLLMVLYPLFIGKAIQSAIDQEFTGLFYLGGLTLATLIVGSGRRFFDSRVYGKIYTDLSTDLSIKGQAHPISTISANLGLLREVVEFFENSIPALVANLIGLVGTLFVVLSLNLWVFFGCLGVLLLVGLIYLLSSAKTHRYNHNMNNELERQVSLLDKNEPPAIRDHLKALMKWNVKLSDIETINFGGVWLFMSALLCFAIVMVAQQDGMVYGAIFSLIMYVFQFMESAMGLPFYYQQSIRLKDIMRRLGKLGGAPVR